MNHSFNIEVAELLGIEKAIILENMLFWISKNEANNKHLHDGNTYTYNSQEAFQKLFPYMKLNTVKRVLRELEADGIIETRSDLNPHPHDRTKWYCIPSHSIVRKITLHNYKSNLAPSEKQPCYNDTDINTDINTDKEVEEVDEITSSDLKSMSQTDFINLLRLDFQNIPIELKSGFKYYFGSSGLLFALETNAKVASGLVSEIYKRIYKQREPFFEYLQSKKKVKG